MGGSKILLLRLKIWLNLHLIAEVSNVSLARSCRERHNTTMGTTIPQTSTTEVLLLRVSRKFTPENTNMRKTSVNWILSDIYSVVIQYQMILNVEMNISADI